MKIVCGLKCYTCNRFGHKASQCKNNGEKNKANYSKEEEGCVKESSKPDDQAVAFCSVLALQGTSCEVVWFADSGATHHYINEEELLVNKRRFEQPNQSS